MDPIKYSTATFLALALSATYLCNASAISADSALLTSKEVSVTKAAGPANPSWVALPGTATEPVGSATGALPTTSWSRDGDYVFFRVRVGSRVDMSSCSTIFGNDVAYVVVDEDSARDDVRYSFSRDGRDSVGESIELTLDASSFPNSASWEAVQLEDALGLLDGKVHAADDTANANAYVRQIDVATANSSDTYIDFGISWDYLMQTWNKDGARATADGSMLSQSNTLFVAYSRGDQILPEYSKNFDISAVTNGGFVTYAPEPSAALLLLASLGLISTRGRRRRS